MRAFEEFGTANKTYFLLKEAGQHICELLGKPSTKVAKDNLPGYRALPSEGNDYVYGTVDGWNDCLDALAGAIATKAHSPAQAESHRSGVAFQKMAAELRAHAETQGCPVCAELAKSAMQDFKTFDPHEKSPYTNQPSTNCLAEE